MSLDNLPDGWAIVKLGEIVCQDGLISDGDWIESKDQDQNGNVRLIQLADIGNGEYLNKSAKFLTFEKCLQLNCTFLESGDLLISRLGDPLGKSCIFPGDQKKSITVVDVCIFRSGKNGINHLWLMSMLNSSIIREKIHIVSSGTTRRRISRKNLESITIPLPPLNEQRRIVAKIEDLQGRSNRLKSHILAIKTLLPKFRQSVLSSAFRGDLTKDWRENNPDVEPAEITLEKIKKERLDQVKTKANYDKLDQIYSYKEENESDNLPSSWKYFTLDKLCQSFEYGSSLKSSQTGEVVVLRMGNIQNGEIDWTNLVYTSNQSEISKYKLSPLTVLFNRTNSSEWVGKTAIYRGEYPAIFAGYLIRINNFLELNPEYLNYALNTFSARLYCSKVKTDGVNQSNINAQKLAKFEIAFCPIEEQKEIVKRIETLFNYADKIEEEIKSIEKQLDNFNQSVLFKAFRGDLVPQDSNDEPAWQLLERIKAEKSEQSRLKGTKKNG